MLPGEKAASKSSGGKDIDNLCKESIDCLIPFLKDQMKKVELHCPAHGTISASQMRIHLS